MSWQTTSYTFLKLANSEWVTNAGTKDLQQRRSCVTWLLQYTVRLCVRSKYVHLLNLKLNQVCKSINGCKSVIVAEVYLITGIVHHKICLQKMCIQSLWPSMNMTSKMTLRRYQRKILRHYNRGITSVC